jgi:hypothetical protein
MLPYVKFFGTTIVMQYYITSQPIYKNGQHEKVLIKFSDTDCRERWR